jgi:hypothetical protein
MCPPGRESLARAPRVVLTSVACGSEARAPRERGWRSCAGRRLAHPGSADGGRMRAGGWRTQGARMAVVCGLEACAPRERRWRSYAGQRPAHPGSADGGRVRVGGWRSWGTGAFFRDNSARQSLKTRGSLHDLGVRSTSSLRQWHKNVISRYYLYR